MQTIQAALRYSQTNSQQGQGHEKYVGLGQIYYKR